MTVRHLLIGISVSTFAAVVPSAFAADVATMDQPDNGFYEGPNPEWATLHATDTRATPEHRQYHRDASQALLLWNAEHASQKGTAVYNRDNRLNRQQRNMLHRQFHAFPLGL